MTLQRPFNHLTDLLGSYLALIQYRPFRDILTPPALSESDQSLLAVFGDLSEDQIEALEQSPQAYHQWIDHRLDECNPPLRRQLAFIREFEQQLEVASTRQLTDMSNLDDRFLQVGIPGRKWQQIHGFVAQLHIEAPTVVDWCSGKGHLARLVKTCHPALTVHALEYDQLLCQAGEALNSAPERQVEFHHQDVLQSLPASLCGDDTHHSALHACGDLHLALLKHAARYQVQGMTLSPCCYHKSRDHTYRPLSREGRLAGLSLTRDDLALAVSETVTGGNRVVRQRHQERLWRTAFDGWQRRRHNSDRYLPIPSLPKSLLSGTFTEFAHWCCEQKQLPRPSAGELNESLAQAAPLMLAIRQQELAHQMFKRPLELWLVLDRALYLENHGYTVGLSVFCARTDSPRNLLISAHRSG